LVDEIKVGDHVLFVGEVVNALADKGAVNKEGIVNLKRVKTLHHLGSDEFGTLERVRKETN
jgi:flavin reductase (DIM6/NTAB) family NADH-FMN oxidoreductase RutF